eukprot:TRINITY_DN3088_c0_g1_i1.p1 TRINITY_DN3088_c0_g1~~TRINITY_DN3088_c0_g1_i1.p1  ORF type:complete len:387 (+),score=86.08 TRINITY_DN3088_c0_g1_i1:124-1284(+)
MKRALEESAPAESPRMLKQLTHNQLNMRTLETNLAASKPLDASNCSTLTASMRSTAAPDSKMQTWEVLYIFHRHMSGWRVRLQHPTGGRMVDGSLSLTFFPDGEAGGSGIIHGAEHRTPLQGLWWWDHTETAVRMVLEWDFGGGSVYTFEGRLYNELGNERVNGKWTRNKDGIGAGFEMFRIVKAGLNWADRQDLIACTQGKVNTAMFGVSESNAVTDQLLPAMIGTRQKEAFSGVDDLIYRLSQQVELSSKSTWRQLHDYFVLLKWDLNQESESEIAVALTMIKGFSKNLAADICRFRPFRTIEELSTGRHSVPNIGQKKAEKLKHFFYTHGEDGIPHQDLPGTEKPSPELVECSNRLRALHSVPAPDTFMPLIPPMPMPNPGAC